MKTIYGLWYTDSDDERSVNKVMFDSLPKAKKALVELLNWQLEDNLDNDPDTNYTSYVSEDGMSGYVQIDGNSVEGFVIDEFELN